MWLGEVNVKLAILIAVLAVEFVCASAIHAATVVFDDMSNFEGSQPGASIAFTGSTPNTFMGDGYLLTPGTTNITGLDIFPVNTSGTDFTGLQITIYVWGSVNSGPVNSGSPAFGNLLASYTLTISGEFNSGFYFPFEGSTPGGSAPGVILNTPLPISGTNIGITINYQGTTDGVNYSSVNDLTSLISFGTPASVGGEDFNGYYRNVNSETDGNFISSLRSLTGQSFQSLGMRVYGTLSENLPPVANPQTISVLKNGSVNITLTATDPNDDPLTYTVVDFPTNGVLSGSPPNLVYTPNTNYTGPDAFTFEANDGVTNSLPATISLNVVSSAGLVIIPTFDSTILSDPNVAEITNTINQTILTFEALYANPVTVGITFAEMNSGLGQSQTFEGSVTYSNYYNALVANSKTTNDAVALAHLTGGSTDPVIGGANIDAALPLLRALGFSADAPGNNDSTISVNMSLINITRPPSDLSKYDLQSVLSHEIDEVLGTSSGVSGTVIQPADLFRYSSEGARSFTTSGDDAYFSIDGGATLLARYNQNASGDYGDWWSISTHSPVRVQDAFGTPGSDPNLGVEMTVLDSVGWDLVGALPVVVSAPVMQATLAGTTVNLMWNSVPGASYQVQYTTNLEQQNWVDLGGAISASASTTTTNDVSPTDLQRFYRLQVVSVQSGNAQVTLSRANLIKGPLHLRKHVHLPHLDSKPAPAHVTTAPGRVPIFATPKTDQTSP